MKYILTLTIASFIIISFSTCRSSNKVVITPHTLIEFLNNDISYAKKTLLQKGFEFSSHDEYQNDGTTDRRNIFTLSYYDGSIIDGKDCQDVITIWSSSKRLLYHLGSRKKAWSFLDEIKQNLQDFPEGEYKKKNMHGAMLYYYDGHYIAMGQDGYGIKFMLSKDKEVILDFY